MDGHEESLSGHPGGRKGVGLKFSKDLDYLISVKGVEGEVNRSIEFHNN